MSQMGHTTVIRSCVTNGSWPTLAKKIRLLCPFGRVKLFSVVDSESQGNIRSKKVKFPI